jgi:rubredoxin
MSFLKKHTLVRILVKGGVLPPQRLTEILAVAHKAGNDHIYFGSRQDLLFTIKNGKEQEISEALQTLNFAFVIQSSSDKSFQNIVSSYVSADLLPATSWLSSGDYLKILDQFNDNYTLKINIADSKQTLVPLFYGNLNFVTSSIKDYWFLYLRLPKDYKLTRWPYLVAADEIAKIASCIEELLLQNPDYSIPDLIETIHDQNNFHYKAIGRMYASNRSWAGIFWRNNNYPIKFLTELCELCNRTNISKIAITPWKSFLIKDIEEKDLVNWHLLLGRFGITMRHSVIELNWHIPLLDASAMRLKQYIVKQFDKRDIAVSGLSFGISGSKNELPFCSIIIKEKRIIPIPFIGSLFNKYDILHARNFNPNSTEYTSYVINFPLSAIPDAIATLTKKYYVGLSIGESKELKNVENIKEKQIEYYCSQCYTLYNQEYGDPFQNIDAGTSFILLPEQYKCSICEAPKSSFVKRN